MLSLQPDLASHIVNQKLVMPKKSLGGGQFIKVQEFKS